MTLGSTVHFEDGASGHLGFGPLDFWEGTWGPHFL